MFIGLSSFAGTTHSESFGNFVGKSLVYLSKQKQHAFANRWRFNFAQLKTQRA